MALVINTNIASMNAQKNLANTQAQQSVTFQRLSTGLRVNSAKDDAAGLYLAQAQTKDIRGLNMATRNAGDGISMAQTAEGALDQIGKNLQRINELSIQSANGSYNDAARGGLQKEVDELTQEINRIVETTEFNGQKLLSKDSTSTTLQIGFKNDAGSMIKTGLEGGLVAQGSGAKFTFDGADKTYYNKDQAEAAGQLALARNFLNKDADPTDLLASPAYTAVELNALAGADEGTTARAIGDQLAQMGNGDSFTVDGMTFTRQSQAYNDEIGQQLKVEFNGKETTIDDVWGDDGIYAPDSEIGTANMADLFGTAAATSPDFPLAEDYFTSDAAEVTYQANEFAVEDLKAFSEGVLSGLKGGESVEVDGVTFTRNDGALEMRSAYGSNTVSIADVFDSDPDVVGIDEEKTFAAGDFDSLFGNASKEVGIMADLLTGDLSATKVIDISSQASAQGAIEFTREAIDLVSELRATFGANMNRFEAVISGNQTYAENLSAARSRIEDADFAQETANLAKQQVLQQAGVAALGQANASAQVVLGLL